MYRQEAQNALRHLKSWKRKKAGQEQSGLVEWDGAFLQRQFERKFQFYLRFHKSYFTLYRHTMAAYKARGITANPYKDIRHDQTDQTIINQAA